MVPRSKRVWHVAPGAILLIFLPLLRPAGNAQTSSSSANTMRAVSKAQNEGRLLDAEKILRQAIAETEQNDPKSPMLGNYLRRLALIVSLDGDPSQAAALGQRALQADRAALGP